MPSLFKILGGEVPVDQAVEEGVEVVWAAVLEVDVVGVFPDVGGEERGFDRGRWEYRRWVFW